MSGHVVPSLRGPAGRDEKVLQRCVTLVAVRGHVSLVVAGLPVQHIQQHSEHGATLVLFPTNSFARKALGRYGEKDYDFIKTDRYVNVSLFT